MKYNKFNEIFLRMNLYSTLQPNAYYITELEYIHKKGNDGQKYEWLRKSNYLKLIKNEYEIEPIIMK